MAIASAIASVIEGKKASEKLIIKENEKIDLLKTEGTIAIDGILIFVHKKGAVTTIIMYDRYRYKPPHPKRGKIGHLKIVELEKSRVVMIKTKSRKRTFVDKNKPLEVYLAREAKGIALVVETEEKGRKKTVFKRILEPSY